MSLNNNSNNLTVYEKVAELQRNLKQIEIEWGKSSKLQETAKKTKRLELIAEVFNLVPSLAEKTSKEEFLKKYGSHSSEIAKAAFAEFAIQEIPKISNDVSQFFRSQKVLVPTGEFKRIKIKSGDETGELDDYVEIPDYKEIDIEVIEDKNGLVASVENQIKQEMYSVIENQFEQSQSTKIDKQVLDGIKSEIYETLHGVFSNMKRTKVQTKNKELTFDLANTIEKYSQWNHFKQLTQKILKDFQQLNGIIPKTQEIDRNYTVATPDGKQLKKTEKKTVQILAVDPNVSSDFTKTLFNSNIEDTEGNKVNLYEIWEQKLGTILSEAMLKYINENPEISFESDIRYFDVFKNVINQTSSEFCKEYSVPVESMGAIIPEKPVAKKNQLNQVSELINAQHQKVQMQYQQANQQTNPPLITSQSFASLPESQNQTSSQQNESVNLTEKEFEAKKLELAKQYFGK